MFGTALFWSRSFQVFGMVTGDDTGCIVAKESQGRNSHSKPRRHRWRAYCHIIFYIFVRKLSNSDRTLLVSSFVFGNLQCSIGCISADDQ